jgi:threonine/homoserine/homoserine lactone efflux protein
VIAHFFIAFGLSFIGSLPFGMINMMVAHTAIEKGLRYALWAAAGAALVEFFQVFIAIKFTWLFTENPTTDFWFKLVATLVFFAAGTYFFFFAKMRRKMPDEQQVNSRRSEFLKGALVSSLNLMVIPFWIFYGTLLATNGLLVKDNQHVLAFSCGTVFGTFTLLLLYALLGDRILSRSAQVTGWVNKFIGLALYGFGIYQLVKLMHS